MGSVGWYCVLSLRMCVLLNVGCMENVVFSSLSVECMFMGDMFLFFILVVLII